MSCKFRPLSVISPPPAPHPSILHLSITDLDGIFVLSRKFSTDSRHINIILQEVSIDTKDVHVISFFLILQELQAFERKFGINDTCVV